MAASAGVGRESHRLTTSGADDTGCSTAYAGQRTSPTTISICVYAGVSVVPSVKS
jgi:hypothetical protein